MQHPLNCRDQIYHSTNESDQYGVFLLAMLCIYLIGHRSIPLCYILLRSLIADTCQMNPLNGTHCQQHLQLPYKKVRRWERQLLKITLNLNISLGMKWLFQSAYCPLAVLFEDPKKGNIKRPHCSTNSLAFFLSTSAFLCYILCSI